jgi:hypothetical protein
MRKHSVLRLSTLVLTVLTATAGMASAQFTTNAGNSLMLGEQYRIEGAANFWNPNAHMAISSQSLGIPGEDIDFKRDLGLTDQRFRELRLVLRPAKKHKFRFQYVPIKYEQRAVVTRDLQSGDNCFGISFNDQCFTLSLPVNSTIDWRAYRFGYEYDFLTKERFFAGFVLDVKYTDVSAELASPGIIGAARATAPIPAVGGIFRGYVTKDVSLTLEVTAFDLPDDALEVGTGHYTDVDLYGTYNIMRNVGAQFGWRSFDLGYVVDNDIGDFELRGVYFGIVARY